MPFMLCVELRAFDSYADFLYGVVPSCSKPENGDSIEAYKVDTLLVRDALLGVISDNDASPKSTRYEAGSFLSRSRLLFNTRCLLWSTSIKVHCTQSESGWGVRIGLDVRCRTNGRRRGTTRCASRIFHIVC